MTLQATSQDRHGDGAVHVHVMPSLFYVGVFATLIALTGITVGVSYFDLGPANTIVALVVATMKAALVAAFFMHLSHDKLFNAIAFIAAFVFLGGLFLLTSEDVNERNRVDETNGAHVHPVKGEVAPGGMSGK